MCVYNNKKSFAHDQSHDPLPFRLGFMGEGRRRGGVAAVVERRGGAGGDGRCRVRVWGMSSATHRQGQETAVRR
jgi:hypothetical protein